MKRIGLTTLLILLMWSCCQQLAFVHAQETVFSDDFSQGLNKWQLSRGSQEYWSIDQGRLKAEIPYRFQITELVPKDEFWNANWHDLEYRFSITPMKGVDRNASFNIRNIGNWFEVHFVDTFFNLVRLIDQNIGLNSYHAFSMENGKTYQVSITFWQGKTTVTIDGQPIATSVDDTFVNQYGKIGLKASTGTVAPSVVYFDNVTVTLLPTQTSNEFIHFKQHDPQWGANEYDHAKIWDTVPTISRWGCALTSLAMIFRYHHLQYLPNGELITPATLNEWLKNQPDGYLFEGYVNWLAATRLSKLISDRHGTPALEYRRFPGDDLAVATQELQSHRPVILEIAGHFLVGSNLLPVDNNIGIADPAYNYSTFAEHHQPLLSTRTFTPSHTDLSYIMIVVPQHVNVQVMQDDQLISVQQETFSISAWQSPIKTPQRNIYTIPKPKAGSYTLLFTSAGPLSVKPQILTYQVDGQVTIHQPELTVGPFSNSLELTFSKTTASQLQSVKSHSSLHQLLFWLRWYLPNQHYAQLTELEHQLLEASYQSPQALETTMSLIKAAITPLLVQQTHSLQSFVEEHFPLPP